MRSKEEELLSGELELSRITKNVKKFHYEPGKLQIGVARFYTPDFVVFYRDRVEVVEVKGYPCIVLRGRRNHVAEAEARKGGINKFMAAAFIHQGEYPTENGVTTSKLPLYYRLVELNKIQWNTIFLIKDGVKLGKKERFPLHHKAKPKLPTLRKRRGRD